MFLLKNLISRLANASNNFDLCSLKNISLILRSKNNRCSAFKKVLKTRKPPKNTYGRKTS